jgi:hypothetical protein
LSAYLSALCEKLSDSEETLARFNSIRSSHHYRFAAYCAMRTQDTASSDQKTSHLYSLALQAEIQLLHRLSS